MIITSEMKGNDKFMEALGYLDAEFVEIEGETICGFRIKMSLMLGAKS